MPRRFPTERTPCTGVARAQPYSTCRAPVPDRWAPADAHGSRRQPGTGIIGPCTRTPRTSSSTSAKAPRLERFGDRLVDRPFPAALGARRTPEAWRAADLRFDRDGGWSGAAAGAGAWPIELAGVALELRPTEAGQLGVFPEHAAMLPWLRARIDGRIQRRGTRRAPADRPPPLRLHRAGDPGPRRRRRSGHPRRRARPTVAWARRNAELLGAGRPRRSAGSSTTRAPSPSVRRAAAGATPGVVLDPPSYGHGGGRAGLADRGRPRAAPRSPRPALSTGTASCC